MQFPETPSGPKKWQQWANQVKAWCQAKQPLAGKNVKLTEFPGGTMHEATGSAAAGADNLEEVTGAANGVPATLQVQTDGNGWTAV